MNIPSAIIFVSNNLVQNVLDFFVKQLYIDVVMDGYTFDGYVDSDPFFIQNIRSNKQRYMVLRPFTELENRTLADVVMYFSDGLISVEYNKFGPPCKAMQASQMYWGALCVWDPPVNQTCCSSNVIPGCCSNCGCGSDGYGLCVGCGNAVNYGNDSITCGGTNTCPKCQFTADRPGYPTRCTCCGRNLGYQTVNMDVGTYVKYKGSW